MSLESISEKLTKKGLAVQLPIGLESGFIGSIDLITMKLTSLKELMEECCRV